MQSDSSYKKAPEYPGAKNQTQARQSGLGHHIGDCEKNDNRERADQKHVANVVTRDAGARFSRALHDTIVLRVRHRSLRRQQRRNNNASAPRVFRARPQTATGANVECPECLSRQRHVVRTIFLGIG